MPLPSGDRERQPVYTGREGMRSTDEEILKMMLEK